MEYTGRIKWKLSKKEYEELTLREYFAFLEIENPRKQENSNLIYADNFL